jgi:hypothetical protein
MIRLRDGGKEVRFAALSICFSPVLYRRWITENPAQEHPRLPFPAKPSPGAGPGTGSELGGGDPARETLLALQSGGGPDISRRSRELLAVTVDG